MWRVPRSMPQVRKVKSIILDWNNAYRLSVSRGLISVVLKSSVLTNFQRKHHFHEIFCNQSKKLVKLSITSHQGTAIVPTFIHLLDIILSIENTRLFDFLFSLSILTCIATTYEIYDDLTSFSLIFLLIQISGPGKIYQNRLEKIKEQETVLVLFQVIVSREISHENYHFTTQ